MDDLRAQREVAETEVQRGQVEVRVRQQRDLLQRSQIHLKRFYKPRPLQIDK